MPLIPVIHADPTVRAALRRGFPRRGTRVVTCRSVERLRATLGAEVADAVVIDVLRREVDGMFQLAGAFPRIPFFALSAFRADHGVLIARCLSAGIRAVLVDAVDRSVAGETIRRLSASSERRRVLADAPGKLRLTEPIQRDAWDEILKRAAVPTSTAEVARALGHTREHLSREFAAGGAPNLKRVIDLARTVCAADLLGNPGYTVADVGRVLRYSSPSHFAGGARRIAGTTPAGLASLGPRGVFLRFLKGRTRSRI